MRAVRTRKWELIVNFEFAPWQETSPDYKNNPKSDVEISNALDVPCDVQYHPPLAFYDLEQPKRTEKGQAISAIELKFETPQPCRSSPTRRSEAIC
jgi:hypothetical protein